jgi:hypothetical protein
MTPNFVVHRLSVAAASVAATAGPSAANIIARTPTISGNGWVALGILGVFIGTVYMLIAGALHVERRDARLGRRSGNDNGWFGVFSQDSDDDDGHGHHGNGGDGS